MNNIDIKTGDRVLCKVGDFPPWPAVVVPQRFLSKVVYSGKRSKNYICVAFFNDDSYYWKEPRHLTLLTDELYKEWIKKNSGSHDITLLGAYEQANKYVRLYDFLKDRLIQENRKDVIENVKDIPDGEDPFEPKINLRRSNSSKSCSVKKRTRSTVSGHDVESEKNSTYQSERGSHGSINNFLPGSETQFSSFRQSSLSKRRKIDYENRVSIAQLLRNKLQRNLVQRDKPPSEAEYHESDKLFKTILERLVSDPPFFDYQALSVSKLYKLLKVIANNSALSRYYDDCERILISWSPIITQIKEDKHKTS